MNDRIKGIFVDDELPQNGEEVLVWLDMYKMDFATYIADAPYGSGWYTRMKGFIALEDRRILFWAPEPVLPKEIRTNEQKMRGLDDGRKLKFGEWKHEIVKCPQCRLPIARHILFSRIDGVGHSICCRQCGYQDSWKIKMERSLNENN